jgi:hypothetical protein
MKKLLSFTLFCYALVIASCSKSINEPPASSSGPAPTAAKNGRLSTTASPLELITSQTWVYYEYFTDFNNNPTNLVWKTNSSSNALNLALNQVQFFTNGTYTETDQNGTVYNGTWTFLNNETQVQVNNPIGTFISTIQTLTSDRYEWLQDNNGNYGVMVPQNQVIDTTGGKLQLLTEHPWVYTEYFTNFNQATPSLIWKPNKANSPLNLAQNWVKYETNGTYTEIDQNGTVYNGTWTFLNNQTQVQVSNPIGTFTSTIQVLGTDRYEWLSTDGITYGEMEHP